MNGEHRYQEIARVYRGLIDREVYRPGEALPRLSDIAQQEHVALGTARQAMEMLDREGLTSPGRPRRVALRRRTRVHLTRPLARAAPGEGPALGADAWAAAMLADGREIAQDVEALPKVAGPEVAARLDIGDHEIVWLRRQERYADGQPDSRVSFWFTEDAVKAIPALALPANIEQGSVSLLEGTWELDEVIEMIWRPATAAEAVHLRTDWVTEVWRTLRRARGPRVATAQALFGSERIVLVFP